MKWAQEKSGRKLHLICESGEEYRGDIVRADLSQPLCGRKVSGYRMIINIPLANQCGHCGNYYARHYASRKESEK